MCCSFRKQIIFWEQHQLCVIVVHKPRSTLPKTAPCPISSTLALLAPHIINRPSFAAAFQLSSFSTPSTTYICPPSAYIAVPTRCVRVACALSKCLLLGFGGNILSCAAPTRLWAPDGVPPSFYNGNILFHLQTSSTFASPRHNRDNAKGMEHNDLWQPTLLLILCAVFFFFVFACISGKRRCL